MGLRGSAPPVFKTVEHDSEITTDAREDWPSIDLISTVPILMLSFSGRSLLTAAVGRFNNSTARKPFDKANLAYIGYKPLRSLCDSSAAHDSDQMAADSKVPGDQQPALQESRRVINLWGIIQDLLFVICRCGSCWSTRLDSGIIDNGSRRASDCAQSQ